MGEFLIVIGAKKGVVVIRVIGGILMILAAVWFDVSVLPLVLLFVGAVVLMMWGFSAISSDSTGAEPLGRQ